MPWIVVLISSLSLSACVHAPSNRSSRYHGHSDYSDLESLDGLLAEEHNQQASQETENLRLGMPKNRVESALGNPQDVEVAGSPDYGTERWIYEGKVIYFEKGNVVGWESQQ